MLYTLRVMLPSLTALTKTFQTGAINFSKITPNIEKTKSNLQQISDKQKSLMLLRTGLKNRLQSWNLNIDNQVEETIHGMKHDQKTHKNNVMENGWTFSHVSCILDAFLIFELDNIPTNTTSRELVCMVTVK